MHQVVTYSRSHHLPRTPFCSHPPPPSHSNPLHSHTHPLPSHSHPLPSGKNILRVMDARNLWFALTVSRTLITSLVSKGVTVTRRLAGVHHTSFPYLRLLYCHAHPDCNHCRHTYPDPLPVTMTFHRGSDAYAIGACIHTIPAFAKSDSLGTISFTQQGLAQPRTTTTFTTQTHQQQQQQPPHTRLTTTLPLPSSSCVACRPRSPRVFATS